MTNKPTQIMKLIAGVWMMLVAGCVFDNSDGDGRAASFTVGGSVFGLQGTLVLELNGGSALTLSADGTFTFPDVLSTGTAYAVTVRSQPATQTCTVSNGSGTVRGSNITNVTVNCSAVTRTVGGTVSGLAPAESVVLQNNGADDLTIDLDGAFSFSTPVAQGAAYNVSILAQPATQMCTVTDGSGVAGTADIGDIQVTCANNASTVGGTVSGLSGTVVLQNNGADDLSINGNGAFSFSTPVARGAGYNVTILAQPAAQNCTVTNGGGVVGGADISGVAVSCVDHTTTLAVSSSDLALSVTGLTEYGVSGTPASGLARVITLTNTGGDAAFNVSIAVPTWPAGTTSSTTCGATLAAANSCTITITPGNTATSDGTNPCSGGTAPVPDVVQVTSDSAGAVSTDVVILSYGCMYQSGYVYAFDDTTPNTGSVGGKVAATSDQAAPGSMIWSSNGSGSTAADVAYDAIFGISDLSTSGAPDPNGGQVAGQAACNGTTDGPCNTTNIHVYYQNDAVGAPINPAFYAAGLCTQTIGGYSDWYLPAICEMGYVTAGSRDGGCGTSAAPTLQNMQSSLVDFNGLNLLAADYWSSTEYSLVPLFGAWYQNFASGGASYQVDTHKFREFGVRCSRALTL